MPNFNNWVSGGIEAMDEGEFAASAWAIIQRKPAQVVLFRNGTALAAQTMRVEYSNTQKEFDAATDATGSLRDVVLLGVRNHPTEPDTDLKRGDQFGLDGRLFRVTDVIVGVGKVEARTEAIA